MYDCKTVSTPLANHFKLSSNNSPQSKEELDYMESASDANAVSSLMHLIV